MLLVVRNILNASDDSVVMVTGTKINWFDLSAKIAKQGPGAFGDMRAPSFVPARASRFCVNPLMTDAQIAKSEAIARAATLFGPINDQWTAVWPAGDTTLNYPAMKAGLAAASPIWDGQRPPGPNPMELFTSVIFVWIVPPNDRPVTVTRIELVAFDSVGGAGGIRPLSVADGTYLLNPNATWQPQDNPVSRMAVQMTSWALPASVTTVQTPPPNWNDPWAAFLSVTTIAPAVAPPGFGTAAMQTIALPNAIASHARDFIDDPGGDPDLMIPGAPMVLFDLIVADKVMPRYAGVLDYAQGEVLFDQSVIRKLEEDMLKTMKAFAWMFSALVGLIEWDDPILGGIFNIFIDVENPPS